MYCLNINPKSYNKKPSGQKPLLLFSFKIYKGLVCMKPVWTNLLNKPDATKNCMKLLRDKPSGQDLVCPLTPSCRLVSFRRFVARVLLSRLARTGFMQTSPLYISNNNTKKIKTGFCPEGFYCMIL